MIGRAAIVVVVAAGLLGVVWMFTGPVAHETAVSNSQVLGALAGVTALAVTVMVLWPRGSRRGMEPPSAGHAQAAIVYLANETLRYWRIQAKERRITTPSPASVRWAWASADVAVPARELRSDLPVASSEPILDESPLRLLTVGVVTELREHLYEPLDDTGRRIVVLGGPGAGKTAAMLLLLIDILEHRPPDSDQPVPVWLPLGGWNPQDSTLLEWAAATLARDYPGLSAPAHGGPGTAAELIRTGRIALFLDGLDEMAPAIQGAALNSIDRDAAGLKIVLTSRPDEYQDALVGGRLYGAAVIDVLPVDVKDATAFLLAEQLGHQRRAWQHVTDHLREHPDSVAARTLTTPLALSLARDTYTRADHTPADLLDTDTHPDPDALLQHLLARSLTHAYPDPAEHAHATRWLSWIAQRMGSNRDLRWWDIPTWTPRWQLRLGTVAGLGTGLVLWLGTGLRLGLVGGLVTGLMAGLVLGLAFGLAGGHRAAAGPQALTVRWPTFRELRAPLVPGLGLGLVVGLALGLGAGLHEGLGAGLRDGLGAGLMVGLGAGLPTLTFRLVEIWSTPMATAHAVGPWDVYRSDRRRALVVGLVLGLAVGLVVGLVLGLAVGLVFGLVFWLGAGLVFGLETAPALHLAVVQMIWLLRGQRVRFVPLLQTALHRQILRQAGAVYQFRHAALQDFLQARRTAERPTGVIDMETPGNPT